LWTFDVLRRYDDEAILAPNTRDIHGGTCCSIVDSVHNIVDFDVLATMKQFLPLLFVCANKFAQPGTVKVKIHLSEIPKGPY
jgi:hypothetical protein